MEYLKKRADAVLIVLAISRVLLVVGLIVAFALVATSPGGSVSIEWNFEGVNHG